MQAGAQIQAAIEVLEEILTTAYPADQIIRRYFHQRRYIGAEDKRVVAERIYNCLRNYFYLVWLLEEFCLATSGRLLIIAFLVTKEHFSLPKLQEVFCGRRYHPSPLQNKELHLLESPNKAPPQPVAFNIPYWTYPFFTATANYQEEIRALQENAPFDLRVNSLKANRDEVLQQLQKEGINCAKTPFSPWGIRLRKRFPLPAHSLWKNGALEVQDEGSQIVSLLVAAQPGEVILDLCAGAGGKTLALATTMKNQGRLIATDVVPERVNKARLRLRRAGVFNTECRLLDKKGLLWLLRQKKRFDKVLIDAPCSGSGTWRRNPDLKFRITAGAFEEIIAKQAKLLDQAESLVKEKGHLIYVTCSLFSPENELQIENFLTRHPNFKVVTLDWQNKFSLPYPRKDPDFLHLSPYQTNTDGFFMATLVSL